MARQAGSTVPGKIRIHDPVSVSHSRTEPSAWPVARKSPRGVHARDTTGHVINAIGLMEESGDVAAP
jgi:hypothetical protein